MRRLLPVLAAALATALLAVPSASADPLLPPRGQLYAGLAGAPTVTGFEDQTGKHPAIFQSFVSWDRLPNWAFVRAVKAGSRPMIHVATTNPAGQELITPAEIAAGQGDAYLVGLNGLIASYGMPTYVRLMAEMDAHWNVYSAFAANGRARRGHSTAAFRAAWRRFVLVVRGGDVATIDARLHALHQPPVATDLTVLPKPPVAFLWVPQVAGAPDTRANAPRAYWPGSKYVDWVGTDFYAKFPNFTGLERFYREFPGKPFLFGEWALWGKDDPAFVHRFFRWVRSHPRVRMLIYNQGENPVGPFRLAHYPRATRALAAELASPRIPAYAP